MASFFNMKYLIFACVFTHAVLSAAPETVIYWGQESDGKEKDLREYCTGTYDIIVMGFAYMFPFAVNPSSNYPALNFASHCETPFDDSDPNLLNCPSIGADITYCQSQGVKIFMSFGGGVGLYGFDSDSQAVTFATTIWDMFMEGNGPFRPFGAAIIDGVDLDIEGGGIGGYVAMINQLRQYFATSKRTYYISSAPQCPYPDGRLGPGTGTALQSGWFDYVWVQFYNNYCGIQDLNAFNFNSWANWARTISVNPNVKVLIGAPAGPRAAGSGYISSVALQAIHTSVLATYSDVYGGIMLWDTSNSDNNNDFGSLIASFVHVGGSTPVTPVTPPTIVTTSRVIPATTGHSSPITTGSRSSIPSTTGATPKSVTTGMRTSSKSTTGKTQVIEQSASTSTSSSGSITPPSSSTTCVTGNMKCLTSETYSTCTHGSWAAAQSCQVGLQCTPSGNYIYCT